MTPQTLPATTLTNDQQQAWLGMAIAKNNITADLTNQELAAQMLLRGLPNDHAAIDSALASYRKAHTEMVEHRKAFTGILDAAIIQPLMAFEKRVDPKTAQEYISLANRSLELRKAAADTAARTNNINQELAQFKAHCQNELGRVIALYRQMVRGEINNLYAFYLEKRISPELPQLHAHLAKIEMPMVNKFNPQYITTEQMQAAYQSVPQPHWQTYFDELLEECNKVFANFDSDMANASAALANREQETAAANVRELQTAQEEAAVNPLIATAEAVVMETPTIKKSYTIVLAESEAWAKAIMAGFISNLPALAKYIRVKSWSRLTIGQMAEYLAKYATDGGTKIAGVQYEENEK